MKVAVLCAMLPKDIQERSLDTRAVDWDGAKESEAAAIYGKVKEDVKNIAKFRSEMVTAKQMEVDRVQNDWAWLNDEAKKTENCEEDVETDENQNNFVGKGLGKGRAKVKARAGHAARSATELQTAANEAGMGLEEKAKGDNGM